LLSVADNTRDRAMIAVLLRTGMRTGELLNLPVGEVNLKERSIEIYEAEKTRVGGVVYLGEGAPVCLAGSQQAACLLRSGSSQYDLWECQTGVCEVSGKAALSHRGCTLHCLRHTCAGELLNAGMRLECLPQVLFLNSQLKKVDWYVFGGTNIRRGPPPSSSGKSPPSSGLEINTSGQYRHRSMGSLIFTFVPEPWLL
jgi:site-specific recombinase XerD